MPFIILITSESFLDLINIYPPSVLTTKPSEEFISKDMIPHEKEAKEFRSITTSIWFKNIYYNCHLITLPSYPPEKNPPKLLRHKTFPVWALNVFRY